MIHFLYKVRLFLVLPVFIAFVSILVFLFCDPFKIVRKYDNYSGYKVNLEYVTMSKFDEKYQKERYDSFIFGSSRVLGFRASSWQKYLKQDSHVYVFSAYYENLTGFYNKLKYLDSLGIPIKNSLVLIDPDLTFEVVDYESKGFFAVKHPNVSSNTWFHFYLAHISAYFTFSYQKQMYSELLGLTKEPVQSGAIRDIDKVFDPLTNEFSCPNVDSYIEKLDSNNYFFTNVYRFPTILDENIIKENKIQPDFRKILEEIKEIFMKHKTEFKIIISPLYSQIRFNNSDMDVLYDIFGENLYDFSGRNFITVSKYNYYEHSHYRPHVGDTILKLINQHN